MLAYLHSERLDIFEIYKDLSESKEYYQIYELNENIIRWMSFSNVYLIIMHFKPNK